MPMYTWVDKLTGLEIDILRSFSQYQDEPKDEDLPEEERAKVREWVKQLGAGIRMVKGDTWGPGKGHW